MQAKCVHCGTEHNLKDADSTVHPKVQFRCSKCGKTTVVEVKWRPDQTVVISPLPSFARADASSSDLKLPPADNGLKLPGDGVFVLAIVSGPASGEVFRLMQPRVVIGRKGADIPLNDPEISRHHCLLEIRDKFINLKDLNSTNGTFYDEERVRAAMLQDGSEFRIGESLIRISF
ncbi:MAG: FHA domain-containing protein, partial [Candidatus Acidiferrum sp.]